MIHKIPYYKLLLLSIILIIGCDELSINEQQISDVTAVGGTFTHQFDTAGEFGYKCGIHSSMTGTIIVQ